MLGDTSSNLGQLYDTYAPKIYRYLFHRLGDQALAEDLTGEVFLRFLRARPDPDNVQAFLYRMAHNLIVDHVRRQRPTLPLDEELAATGPDPAQLAAAALESARLRRALLRLTADQQQVVTLRFLEGFSTAEVAQILRKPEGAIKALQHRGLTALRELLADTPHDRTLEWADHSL